MGITTTGGGWCDIKDMQVSMTGDIADLEVTADHIIITPDADGYSLKSMTPPDPTLDWRARIVNADQTYTRSIILPLLSAGGTPGFQFFFTPAFSQVTLAPSQTQSVVYVPGAGWLIEVQGTLS